MCVFRSKWSFSVHTHTHTTHQNFLVSSLFVNFAFHFTPVRFCHCGIDILRTLCLAKTVRTQFSPFLSFLLHDLYNFGVFSLFCSCSTLFNFNQLYFFSSFLVVDRSCRCFNCQTWLCSWLMREHQLHPKSISSLNLRPMILAVHQNFLFFPISPWPHTYCLNFCCIFFLFLFTHFFSSMHTRAFEARFLSPWSAVRRWIASWLVSMLYTRIFFFFQFFFFAQIWFYFLFLYYFWTLLIIACLFNLSKSKTSFDWNTYTSQFLAIMDHICIFIQMI